MSKITGEEFKELLRDHPQSKDFYAIMANHEKIMSRSDAYKKAMPEFLSIINGDSTLKIDSEPDYMSQDFGESADLRQDYLWVNDNRKGKPNWGTCPSNGARNIYDDITHNNQMLRRFLDKVSDVLPKAKELAELERRQDDGRKLVKLTHKIRDAKMRAMGKYVDDLGLDNDN